MEVAEERQRPFRQLLPVPRVKFAAQERHMVVDGARPQMQN